jgi:short chain dehydrogenase
VSAADFDGKAALITGGSDGIGLRVAEQLAEAGAHVFINGRSAKRGERAAGSASSLTLIRSTAATSPGSAGATAHGRRHQASTGTTWNPVGGMNSSGRVPRTSTPSGPRRVPVLSRFNRAERGGHFAAWEQPQLLSDELRAAFRTLR